MWIIGAIISAISLFLNGQQLPIAYQWPVILSEWKLFEAPMDELQPAKGVLSYNINAPLYSDYAHKSRFIKLPEGTSARFHPTQIFDMPDGTILIKNFFYYSDERQPEKGKRILETRLIVKNQGIWHAVSYRWNAEQTEAYRAIAGGSMDVAWMDKSGDKHQLHYLIPDANQCKNCHNRNDVLLPLGITARQLLDPDRGNQLTRWQQHEMLDGLPDDLTAIDRMTDYEDNKVSLDRRARSYLDANCGHCHSAEGSARTSGLNLNFEETNPHAYGVMKPPIAAGRGSGGMQYSIVPGKPNQSILLYRMLSSDPGIRMPEINRQIPHAEGIELIRAWIKNMNDD